MVETMQNGERLSATNGHKSTKEDISANNVKLYSLLQTTNIEISYEVFCLLLNLLRSGCTPEAVYVFLRQIANHSKIIKQLKTLKKNQLKNNLNADNKTATKPLNT
ncbi:unnamed protein product [Medioppia subpectinata]|uniref:Uncharacterized protein n=1 Tax=Medioppia subpectinata TaxID=1979941 RepID=A0A7R9QHD2_9ACAR|nr:unnamed protein product [Medioppia subpectinata]CAG2120734.1 unnamed protein product [Medioppia subpectinata]